MSNIKRKLTTILATDCVSFSKHMEQNEEDTEFKQMSINN